MNPITGGDVLPTPPLHAKNRCRGEVVRNSGREIINCFSHIRCSGHSSPFTQPSQSCHGLSGTPKAPFKSFCAMQATLARSLYLILFQEMMLDHFT
jgi:hypothetical protein